MICNLCIVRIKLARRPQLSAYMSRIVFFTSCTISFGLALSLCLAYGSQVSGLHAQEMESSTRIERPEIAVPAFGLLRRYHSSVSLQSVDASIALRMAEGLSEIDAIVETGDEFGVNLQPKVLDPTVPGLIPIPCLLIVSKSGQRGRQGALVLVESRSSDQLQVYDFQSGKGRRFIRYADLQFVWSGDAIVLSIGQSSPHTTKFLFATVVLGIGMGILCWRRPFIRRALRGCLIALFLIMTTGCFSGGNASPPVSTSPFRSLKGAVVDLGELEGDELNQVEFKLPLEVDHPTSITLTGVRGNCTCLQLGEAVIGTTYGPGDQFSVAGILRLDGKIGEDMLILQIHALDENKAPVPVTKVGIRFFVNPRPVSDVDRLVLTAFCDETELAGNVSLIMLRKKEHRPLDVDFRRCTLGGLTMRVLDSQLGLAMEGSDIVRDVIKLEFRLDRSGASTLPSEILLAAVDNDHTLRVSVETRILPPLESEPSSLFLGVLSPGEEVEKRIRIEDRAARGIDLSSVFIREEIAGASLISVDVDGTTGYLKVGFSPSGPVGRGSGTLVLSIGTSDQVAIPISWVIK